MKKALIFDPYLDTLGGGEFYSLSVGQFLIKKGFKVDLGWKSEDIFRKVYQRFGIKFNKRVSINKKAFKLFNSKRKLFKKLKLTKNYDIIFYLSNGSIPFLLADKNFLHFQTPFIGVQGKSLLNQLKLKSIDKIICNSFFTKKYIDKEFNQQSEVVYPPLGKGFLDLKPIKKENIILSVGRFDQILNAKRQDVLIKAFKKMVGQGLKEWQLVLIGGLKGSSYLKKLASLAKGLPIKIFPNAPYQKLKKYYKKAKIYWHAAGFGLDLDKEPWRAEHFGITIIEAMATGCLPVVFNGGGLTEIVDHQKNGFLWQDLDQLIKTTSQLIKDEDKRKKIVRKSRQKSRSYNKERFNKQLNKIFFNNEKNN